ncbi:MAG: Rieske (2Fe-2S) protein [Candidatus Binataceae bacterium]
MPEAEWIVIEDIDPQNAQFPLVAGVNGNEVIIFKIGERLRGIERWCPHEEADLLEGRIMGEMIKCPHHGYIYRLDSGKCMNFQGASNAFVYEVMVAEGKLRLRRLG